jgi:hypothetical protein
MPNRGKIRKSFNPPIRGIKVRRSYLASAT